MGKSLIIKGADFSKNGFTYKYETLDVNTLYYKGTGQASLVQNTNIWPVSNTDGRSFYEVGDTYSLVFNSPNCLVFKQYPIGDYTRVKIRTVANLTGNYVILAFLDSDSNILAGFCTTALEGKIHLTPVGKEAGYREFEMDVPEGAVSIIGGFYEEQNGLTSPFEENGFKVTLSKVSPD